MPDEPQADRLSRIESAISSLTATMDGVVKSIQTHESRLSGVETAANSRGKVDWQAYGFILAFVGGIGYMAKEPMDQRLDTNAQAIRDTDTTLQREMRLLDEGMRTEIRHLSDDRDKGWEWKLNLDRRLSRVETLMENDQ